MKSKTRASQSREEWLADRKTYIGGSDYASVMNDPANPVKDIRYGCSRKLGYDKLEYPKDFDDSDRMEFRRGQRLEHVAASYYQEATGREIRITTRMQIPGKPHLSVNMDRYVYKKEDKKQENPGYLELKVLGRFSFLDVKKNGLIADYVLQVQGGCAVAGCSWGAYGIYCPELDELLQWDVEAEADLGEVILEKADDWWSFHKECKILPEPLPDGSKPCDGCAWSLTCRGSQVVEMPADVINRPDLEALASKFAELKGMGSEVDDAEKELRSEFLAAIGEKPGIYRCGRFEIPFTITKQMRFSSELLKKKSPSMYEDCKQELVIKTLKKPKEV